MSFDNHHYPNRKDHRAEYHGSKAFDRSCRNHGSCKHCERNRLRHYATAPSLEEGLLDWEEDHDSSEND